MHEGYPSNNTVPSPEIPIVSVWLTGVAVDVTVGVTVAVGVLVGVTVGVGVGVGPEYVILMQT